MLRLKEQIRNLEIFIIFIFIISIFFNSLELTFLFSIWLIFYPLDPHIVADPDPGSLNLADPTNPDPKHFQYCLTLYNTTLIFTIILKILVTVNLLSRYYARLTVPLL